MAKFKCFIPNSYIKNGVLKFVDCFQELVQEVVDKADSLGAEKVNVVNIIEPEDRLKEVDLLQIKQEGVRVEVDISDDLKAELSSYMIEYYSLYSWQLGRDEYYYEIDEDSITVHIGR